MLKTETNTPHMMHRIKAAWREAPKMRGAVDVHFEHGQWWICHIVTGAAWSVVDAEGPGTVDGFAFEQVAEGDPWDN